jgi:hypothetical protein
MSRCKINLLQQNGEKNHKLKEISPGQFEQRTSGDVQRLAATAAASI